MTHDHEHQRAGPANPYMARAAAWDRVAEAALEHATAEEKARRAERALWQAMGKHRGDLSLRDLEALTGIPRTTLQHRLPAVAADLDE